MKKEKEETADDIIKAAARIIKAELRDLDKAHTVYPTSTEISDAASNKKWIPDSLNQLLKYFVPSEVKQLSIGSTVREKLRFNLHRFGFSISSDEVTRFKHSAIEATEICPTDLAENETQTQFTQWVAVLTITLLLSQEKVHFTEWGS